MQGQNSLGQWRQLLGLQTPKDNLIKLLMEENEQKHTHLAYDTLIDWNVSSFNR